MKEMQCNARGKYPNGEGSRSLLIAVSGDERVSHAFSFHRCFMEGGTDIWKLFSVMSELCDWLAANHPGRLFAFANG